MRLACRQIRAEDRHDATELLSKGFPQRTGDYWRQAFDRLAARVVPEGYPRFGYVLTDHGRLVGIILTIFAKTDTGALRGNVSSWFVQEAYRGFSHVLLAAPLKFKGPTLFNISPAPHTIGTIRAQGFSSYVNGTFAACAALAPRVSGARVRRIAGADGTAARLLVEHAGWSCVCVEVSHAGATHPFVFAASRLVSGRLPGAQLLYCRSTADFVKFAGPLGRHLLRLGFPLVLIDADGPIAGLLGAYRDRRGHRYFIGPERPRTGDLSYSELAIFGS